MALAGIIASDVSEAALLWTSVSLRIARYARIVSRRIFCGCVIGRGVGVSALTAALLPRLARRDSLHLLAARKGYRRTIILAGGGQLLSCRCWRRRQACGQKNLCRASKWTKNPFILKNELCQRTRAMGALLRRAMIIALLPARALAAGGAACSKR